MRLRQLAMVLFALVLACATGTSPVTTTAGEKKGSLEYPESEYLTAEGLGQSEPEARNRALAELSRIFESRIRTDTLDRMRSVLSASGAESFEQEVESKVRVATDIELQGVEIARVWNEGGYTKALAVLEREKAFKIWKSRMDELDAEADGHMGTYRSSATTLGRYRALRAVTGLWVEREVLAARVTVLGYKPPPSSFEVGEVYRSIPALRADMPVLLDIESGYSDLVRDSIGEALGKAGFVMTYEESEASVIVDGTITVTSVDIEHPKWKYARAVASLSVIDAENGQVVSDVAEDRRGSHLSESEAAEKAVKKLAPKVVEAIVSALGD